jgi:K(+)-stimulated pyrophosphate-energized sodium pump
MMLPGAITIVFPIIIGFLMGAEALGAYMAGVAVSGVLWAIFQNNAGGAWDNAKKSFEAGVMINGEMTFKGSDAHKAAVTGDTVGDPFKDTSGPSMNILIKLTCLVGLVIAPILGSGHGSEKEGHCDKSKCEMKAGCDPSSCDQTGNCDMSKCKGSKKECHGQAACEGEKNGAYMVGPCDVRECANMTKEECAKMCDEKGCTPEEKETCLAHCKK